MRFEVEKKKEIFVRLNDPEKINRLANGNYKNTVLQEIKRRHHENSDLLFAFFSEKLTDDERWNLIEEYFLGNNDYVKEMLHISS